MTQSRPTSAPSRRIGSSCGNGGVASLDGEGDQAQRLRARRLVGTGWIIDDAGGGL